MGQPDAIPATSDDELPHALIDRGWQQGTIFWAPGAQASSVRPSGGEFVTVPQETPSDGRFVVVSQTCDINADLLKEPVVEAFPCVVEPDQGVRATYSKSFRQFEIDPVEGLMAHAAHRVAFAKPTLLDLEPLPWPSSPERLNAFARWLGGRAARPAIPNPIVKAFVKPLDEVLQALRKKDVSAFIAFNGAVAEILIRLPESELPPFTIPVRLLLSGDGLSMEAANAITLVEDKFRAKLDPAKAQLLEFLPTTQSRMSVETYLAMTLVELSYLTYQGDEVIGAAARSASQ